MSNYDNKTIEIKTSYGDRYYMLSIRNELLTNEMDYIMYSFQKALVNVHQEIFNIVHINAKQEMGINEFILKHPNHADELRKIIDEDFRGA